MRLEGSDEQGGTIPSAADHQLAGVQPGAGPARLGDLLAAGGHRLDMVLPGRAQRARSVEAPSWREPPFAKQSLAPLAHTACDRKRVKIRARGGPCDTGLTQPPLLLGSADNAQPRPAPEVCPLQALALAKPWAKIWGNLSIDPALRGPSEKNGFFALAAFAFAGPLIPTPIQGAPSLFNQLQRVSCRCKNAQALPYTKRISFNCKLGFLSNLMLDMDSSNEN